MSDHTLTGPQQRVLAAIAIACLLGLAIPSWSALPSIAAEQVVPGFQTIAAEQLAEMLEEKDFLLVNVHIPYEGEIVETDAFIPFDQIVMNLDKLLADKHAAIVLYCRSGRMSEIAATELTALGYTGVANLAGGMVEWESSGQELLFR